MTSATSVSPSTSAEPSASTVMREPPLGLPTMRSISPAKVTRPAVPPNSSMTIAMPEPRSCISDRTSSAAIVSGTVIASRTSGDQSGAGGPPATSWNRSVMDRMPTMSSIVRR